MWNFYFKQMKKWKLIVLILVAIAGFTIKFLTDGDPKEKLINSGILAIIMVIFWILEIIPIYVTALFPLILGIPLEVITDKQLASQYGNSNVFLFLGGFMMALALEKWEVHKQIATGILRTIGKNHLMMLFSFLTATALLSMWISNTATALMMLPMAMSVISALPINYKDSRFTVLLLLAVAYGANVGGMATLVGSPPNIQMATMLNEKGYNIDFYEWLKYGLPLSLILLVLIFIAFYFMMEPNLRNKPVEVNIENKPWTKDQFKVISIFGILIILWAFKDFIIAKTGIIYKDETAALLMASIMFIIPSSKEGDSLLKWKDMKEIPWGILILFGGGLAMATILDINGVIDFLFEKSGFIQTMAFPSLLVFLVFVSIFGTEVMSNLALVTVITPFLIKIGVESGYNPIQICLPVTLAASCAFMLPVGTPPNAIVFASGRIKISQMAKYGFLINILAAIVIISYFLLF